MSYNAGSAFLQIVPSFRGLEAALKAGARDIGKAVSGAVSDALPKGFAEGAEQMRRDAKGAGDDAGKEFNGALIQRLQSTAAKAAMQIGTVKIKTDVDVDHSLETQMLAIGKRLAAFSQQKIKPDFDIDDAITDLLMFRDELTALQRQARDEGLGFNAGEASRQLAVVDDLVRQMAKRGFTAGGEFNRNFNAAAKAAHLSIGDLVTPDGLGEQDAHYVMEQLREQLARQGDLVIPTDLDEDRALREMREILAKLDAVAKDGSTVQLRMDAAAAAAKLRGFLEGVDALSAQHGEVSGRRYMGAYTEQIRQGAAKAAEAAGEIDPTLDLSLDSSAARVQLAAIGEEIRAISTSAGVDLSTEQAQRRLAELLVQVRQIQAVAGQDHELTYNATLTGDLLEKLAALDGEAEHAGNEAGDRFAGAFLREVRKLSADAQAQLSDINVEVDLNPSAAQVKAAALKKELSDLDELITLGMDPHLVLARLQEVRAELAAVRKDAGDDIELRFDTGEADRVLARADELQRRARQAGERDGGAYAMAFTATVQAGTAQLPELHIDADSTDAQRRIAQIRTEMVALGDHTIGVDIDDREAMARLEALRLRLDAVLRDTTLSVNLRSDVEGALGELARVGARDGGAYAESFKTAVRASMANLPDIQIDANSSKLDKRIARIRAVLASLGNLTIGVDIDDATARTEIEKLQAGIRRTLSDETISINVRADLEGALGELDKIYGQAARDAGAYAESFKATLQAGLANLPDIEIDADSSDAQRRIASIRAEMRSLSEQTIGLDIDDHEALARLEQLKVRLEAVLRDRTLSVSLRSDAEGALGDLNTFGAQGARNAGAYAESFRAALSAALQDLPEPQIDADATPAQRKLALLRAQLAELGELTIGVDMDDAEARAEMNRLRLQLEELLRDKSIDVNVRADTEKALREINGFLDTAATDSDKLAAHIRGVLSASLQNLPEVEITSDSTAFEQRLAQIRAQIADTRELHINADIDDETALARIEKFKAELAELAAKSPEITVSVNAARALAELEGIKLAADSIGNSVDNIGTASSSGIGRLAALVSVVLSLGTAAVPAAAAAVASIGAIGTAAGTALAGVGVFALGIFGIVGAVQALDKASIAAATTAKSLGAANKATATATDQVTNAEANLANTRASNADAAITAAQRIKDAETALDVARSNAADANTKASRDLTDAQDAERTSRENLNEAIRAAKDDMAELDLQVRKNSLDQREATSAIAVEKNKLDAILLNPRATQLEKDQARQAYDEKVLQLQSLQLKGKELGQQESDYAKKGLDASDKVKNARKSEKDAIVKVGDAEKNVTKTRTTGARSVAAAEQNVADAQRQQAAQTRQAAQALRTAQQQVVTATRASTQAVTASAAAGGSALSNLQTAMAQLTPTGQDFAKYIFSLKGDFLDLAGIAQDNLLPGLQNGIGELVKHLQPLEDFVGRLARAMGGIFTQFAQSLDSPVFKEFFAYFAGTAAPTMQTLYQIVMNLSSAVVSLFMAMTPFSGNFLGGLVDATARFAQWARALTTSVGYIKFLQYVQDAGPKVVALIGSMATFLGRFFEAAEGVGLKVVGVVTAVFNTLNSMSTDVLAAILGVTGVIGTLVLVLGGFFGAFKLYNSLIAPVINSLKLLTTTLKTTYRKGVLEATAATGALTSAEQRAAGSAAVMGSALNKLFSVGNIVMLTLTALTFVIAGLINKHEKEKQRVDDLTDAYGALGQAYRDTHDLGSQQVQDAITGNKDLAALAKNADALGISLQSLVQAAAGDPGSYEAVNQQISDRITALQDLAKQQEIQSAQDATGLHNPFSGDGIKRLFDPNYDENKSGATATKDQIQSLEDQQKALAAATQQQADLEAIQKKLTLARSTDAAITAAQQTPAISAQTAELNANQQALDAATDKLNTMVLAQGGNAAAQATLFKQALQDQTVQVDKSTGALVTNTKALGDSAQTASVTVSAYNSMVGGQSAFATGLINLKSQIDNATAAHDKHAKSLELNTKDLADNSATAITNRDAITNLAAQSRDAFLADIQAGTGIDTARKAHDKRIESLKQEAKHLGLDTKAVNALIDSQGKIDDKIVTTYDEKNFTDAYNNLQKLNFMQKEIAAGKSAADAQADWKAYQSDLNRADFLGYATGGRIYGPGTKTSDSIPIMASAGEFMQQASAVDYYGEDLMHALNQQWIPREMFKYATGGPIAGYATGGSITANGGKKKSATMSAPITVDYAAMDINTLSPAQARAVALGDAPTGGTAVGSEQVAEIAEATARSLNATVKQLVALIEAGIVESGLRNLSYGDRDSLGFLQQRPSQGWGSAAQIMDVAHATTKFITKAKHVDRASYDAGRLAQAVQVSAFPDRYGKQEANAYAVLNRNPPTVGGYAGGSAAGLGSSGTTEGAPGYQWQIAMLRRAFGDDFKITSTTGGGHADNSWHYRGRAVDFIPPEKKYGQWLLANYGKDSKEIIGPYANMMVKNGQLHDYSAAIKAQHKNHWHWAYDQGGWLQPGVTQVVNATKKPEAVFTNSQFQDIRNLADATRTNVQSTGAGNTYSFDFGNSTLDQTRLNAIQQRSDSLARVNRPNF